MKKFLIGLLTLCMTMAFIALGFARNIENIIVNTASEAIKEEVTNEIVKYVSDETKKEKEEIKQEITKVVEQNDTIKKLLEESFDKALDVLSGKEIENFNVSSEVEELITKSEAVLKEYGVTLTEEEKQELLDMVSSEEFTNTFNESLKDVKENIPTEVNTLIDIFNFIRSTTFELILLGIIIFSLVCIALLKKSCFKWLTNFGESTIVAGFICGILLPFLANVINQELAKNITETKVVLVFDSLKQYGYILLGVGVIAIIINIVLSKITKKEIPNEK